MGRKRKHDPSIPAHIEQRKLPAGVYWDKRDRVWYTIHAGPPTRRQRIAGGDAMMSDLHLAVEQLRGVNRKSLGWLLDQYHDSHVFRAKAASTQKAYMVQRGIAVAQVTKLGVPLGQIDFSAIETKHFQALVDKLADQGTPTKANALMRYLKLVYSWAKRRGHVADNPVKGVQQAKERKRRRLPSPATMTAIIQLAYSSGQLKAHTRGSCPAYLWAVADIAYLCRLRGIEVITLPESHGLADGILTNRRKGSRDNVVAWTPRLRAAWDWLLARRSQVWKSKGQTVIPMASKDRLLVVSEHGTALEKSSLDSAWQRLMARAIDDGILAEDERFGLHDLKRKGITDTAGTRADKQHASGHKTESMMDVYDLSRPVVNPSNMS